MYLLRFVITTTIYEHLKHKKVHPLFFLSEYHFKSKYGQEKHFYVVSYKNPIYS